MNDSILNEWMRVVLQISVGMLFFVAILGLFRYKIVDVFLANKKGVIFGTCRVRLNRFTGTFSAIGKKADRFYVKVFTAPFGAKILTNVVQEGGFSIVLGVIYTSKPMIKSFNRMEHIEESPKTYALGVFRKGKEVD